MEHMRIIIERNVGRKLKLSKHNILNINGYTFGVKSFSEDYLNIKCVPYTDQDLAYVKRYLDSITHRAENIIYNKSDKAYSTEFDNTELYHNGVTFIKTTGLLDSKHKLYGLWPTYISDDGMVDFTFDYIAKEEDYNVNKY